MKKDYFGINKEIFKKFDVEPLILDNGNIRPITIDGPISKKYNQANPRILWVLKEANNKEATEMEAKKRSLIEYVMKGIVMENKPVYRKTYGLLIKISYGILCDNRGTQSFSGHYLNYKKCLESIAVINLNKFGGGNKESKHYRKGSEKCSPLVQSQLKNLKPEIVILAGTGWLFTNIMRNALPNLNLPSASKDNFPTYKDKNGNVYISAYHTGQRTITEIKYYNRIIQNIN